MKKNIDPTPILAQEHTDERVQSPTQLKNALSKTSMFNVIFGTVVGFTLVSGVTAVGIASRPQLTPQQERVFESCQTTWQTGIGAVVGLMGGKAGDLLLQEKKEDQDEDKQ